MPRPRQVSDEQIRTAARKVFHRVGINAPVALIAKALGVTPAALFHRTGSKEQLFVMATTAVEPRQFKVIQALRSGPTRDSSLEDQLIEILTRLSAHLAVVCPNIFLRYAAGLEGRKRRGLSDATRQDLAAWLQRAKPLGSWQFGSAAVLADALVGSIEARHFWGFLHRRRTSVAAEQHFVHALIHELLGPSRSPARRAAARRPGAVDRPAHTRAPPSTDPLPSTGPPPAVAATSPPAAAAVTIDATDT
jgi:AcrR family transcriptional regulator